MSANITIPKEQIVKFCLSNHITRLALLGDAVPDYYPEHRVKVLVEYAPNHTPGGFAFVRMQRELGEILCLSVDLSTPDGINSKVRQRALSEAQDIYAA